MSDFPVAEALFYGNVRLAEPSGSSLWRSTLAVPVPLTEPGTEAYPVWIASISLNSTRPLIDDFGNLAPTTKLAGDSAPSFLRFITPEQRDELAALLRAEAVRLLEPR